MRTNRSTVVHMIWCMFLFLFVVLVLSCNLTESVHAQRKERFPKWEFEIYVRNWCEGECFVIHGDIGYGLPAAFRKEIKKRPDIKKLWLWSHGGYTKESWWLNRAVKKHGIHTYAKLCESACTNIFIGGKTRTLVRGSTGLGFHRYTSFFEAVGGTYMRAEESKMKRLFKKSGVSKKFLDVMFKNTKENKIWYPKHTELLAHGVVHRIIN